MLLLYFALEYWLFVALAAWIFHEIIHITRAVSILGAGLAGALLLHLDFRHRGIWVLLDNLRISRLGFVILLFAVVQACNLAIALRVIPWP